MTAIQVKNVKKYLEDSSFTHTEEWLCACIEWVKENCSTITDAVLKNQVLEQWQDANLEDMESRCLPPNLAGQRCVKLTGRYGVQINCIQDIGESAYNQWNRLKKLENENTNVAVTESTTVKNSWEPKPRRCLYLSITDGSQAVYGLELNQIPCLSLDLKPGAKIIIMGPVECRKGVIQLKSENIKLIGGEVEDLVQRNSVEALLRNILHNPPENLPGTVPATSSYGTSSNSNKNDAVRDISSPVNVPVPEESIFDDDEFFMDIDESEILAASLTNSERANAVTQKVYTSGQSHSITSLEKRIEPRLSSKTVVNQHLNNVIEMPPPPDPSLLKKSSKIISQAPSTSTRSNLINNNQKVNKFVSPSGSKGLQNPGAKLKKQLKIDGYMKPMPVVIKPPTPQKDIEIASNVHPDVEDSIILGSDDDDEALMEIIEGSFAAELAKAEKETSKQNNQTAKMQKSTFVPGKSPPLCLVHSTSTSKIMLPIKVLIGPYIFIKQVHDNWDKFAKAREIFYVKACVATVVSNIQVSDGNWALSVCINDGTGFLNCLISYEILNNIIGFTPSEMKRIKSRKTPEGREQIANGMGNLTTMLVHLNTIIGIEIISDPVIVHFGDVKPNHINELKNRISQIPLRVNPA